MEFFTILVIMRYTPLINSSIVIISLLVYGCTSPGSGKGNRTVILPISNLIGLIGQEKSKSDNYFYKENFVKDSVRDGFVYFVNEGLSRVHTTGNAIEAEVLKNRQSDEFSAIITSNSQVKGIIYSKVEQGLKSNDKNIREALEKSKFKLELIDQPSFAGDHLPPRPIYVKGNITCEYRIYMGGQMVYLQLYDNKALEVYNPL